MARGESPKERPAFPGAAIGASFLAFCLCAITGVAMTTRECNAASVPAAATPEPFVGTIATFHALSWRDTERVRATVGTPTPDAPRARVAVETALGMRGYTPAPAAGLSPLATLPADFEALAMEGSCGVLVVIADGTSTLTRAEVATEGSIETFAAHDPSAMAVPLCGAGRVHVEGTGSAAAHTWHFPGLTPDLARDTSLPIDVLLAHAEAEALLRPRGLTPLDEVAIVEVAGGPGPQPIPLTRSVASGCVVFVGVAIGAGDPLGAWSPAEHVQDRGLVGLARCATRTDASPTLMVQGAGPARLYVRPYRAIGAGAPPVLGAASALRVVSEADLVLPPPLLEAPMP